MGGAPGCRGMSGGAAGSWEGPPLNTYRRQGQSGRLDPASGVRPGPVVEQGSRGSADPTADSFVQRLYADHADFLTAFVLRLTGGDRYWAEDVVQETMVRAWRHAGKLVDGVRPSLLPWLTTVARRIVSNDRRRLRARPQEVDDTMLDVAMVPDDTESAVRRIVIRDALRQIGPIHREVVVELYLRGLSVEQVAARLGVPPGTVKSRSYYAMRALRTVLRDSGVTLDDADT
jgi:RNA polymerase sigma-70 factor (ECF subfamily)